MGKKSKIFYYSTLIVTVVIFILDLLPINFPFFNISFAVTLILIGIMLMIRAFSLKIDSSLFFGTIFLGCGILNFLVYLGGKYWGWATNQFWPYYLFAIAVASLVTAIYFKDKLQAKLFVLFLGFGLITLLFVQHIIVLWLMIVLLVLWFILYFTANILLYKRRKNG